MSMGLKFVLNSVFGGVEKHSHAVLEPVGPRSHKEYLRVAAVGEGLAGRPRREVSTDTARLLLFDK